MASRPPLGWLDWLMGRSPAPAPVPQTTARSVPVILPSDPRINSKQRYRNVPVRLPERGQVLTRDEVGPDVMAELDRRASGSDNPLSQRSITMALDRMALAGGPNLTGVDPKTYRGRNPDGSLISEEQTANQPTVVRKAQAPSLATRFGDAAKAEIEHYSPVAYLARRGSALIPSSEDWIGTPGADNSPEAMRARANARTIQTERDWREQQGMAELDNPTWEKSNGSWGDFLNKLPDNIDRELSTFGGSVAGGVISDPTNIIAPGESLGAKLVGSAGINAGADAGMQGLEMAEGTRDDYNPVQTAIAAATGPVTVLGVEGARKVARWFAGRGGDTTRTPIIDDNSGEIVGDVPSESIPSDPKTGKRRPYVTTSETGFGQPKLPPERTPGEYPNMVEGVAAPVPGERPIAANENLNEASAPSEPINVFTDDLGDFNQPRPAANDETLSGIDKSVLPYTEETGAGGKQFGPNGPEVYSPGTRAEAGIPEEFGQEPFYAADNDVNGGGQQWTSPEARTAPVEEATRTETPGEEPPAGGDTGGEPPHHDFDEITGRLTDALKKAKRLLPEQRAMYRAERSERLKAVGEARATTSGEEGLHAEASALAGELPKKTFEDVRDQFSQEEVQHLFNTIKDHPDLDWFSSIRARFGLKKLLNGELPNKSELATLQRAFPPDFIRAAMSNRSTMKKLMENGANAINLSRAIRSSFDLSAPFRQGWLLMGRGAFWKNFGTMYKTAFAGDAKGSYRDTMRDIHNDPDYELMDRAGVDFTDPGLDPQSREEAFQSPWLEKIPVLGRIGSRSELAFHAYMNKLRFDVTKTYFDKMRDLGIDLDERPDITDAIGKWVNIATGRGKLPGNLDRVGAELGAALFSPRLMSSRIAAMNPVTYVKLPKEVRIQAVRDVLSAGAIGLTTLGLAAATGATVVGNPLASDFGKAKFGNTRVDFFGGFPTYLTFASRMAMNASTTNGGETVPFGSKYGSSTRLSTAARFARSKLSPVGSFIADYMEGKDYTGKVFDADPRTILKGERNELSDLFTPMFLADLYQVEKEQGGVKGTALAGLGLHGAGMNTYNSDIPPAPASLKMAGVDVPLDRDMRDQYDQTLTDFYDRSMKEAKENGLWDGLDAASQRTFVKAIVKEGKEEAKNGLFDMSSVPQSAPQAPTSAPTAASEEAPVDPSQPLFQGFSGLPTSIRRTAKGNEKVGGVANSDHLRGDAVDFVPGKGQSMRDLAEEARKYFPTTATILNEGNHVHVHLPGLGGPLFGARGTAK